MISTTRKEEKKEEKGTFEEKLKQEDNRTLVTTVAMENQ
jgi:hypothetical protein